MARSSLGAKVGQRVREVRVGAGLTQAQLAERLGPKVAVETISRFERGALVPTFDWIGRICRAVEITDEEFFAGLASPGLQRPERAMVRRLLDLLHPLDDTQVARVYQLLKLHTEAIEAARGERAER